MNGKYFKTKQVDNYVYIYVFYIYIYKIIGNDVMKKNVS